MKLYYLVSDIMRPLAVAALTVYGWVTKTPRSRVVVYDERGRILLIRGVFEKNRWSLPGGGANRREGLAEAAVRELSEEVGVNLSTSDIEMLFSIKARSHEEWIFKAYINSSDLPKVSPSRFEVKDMKWFSVDNLPEVNRLSGEILDDIGVRH